MERSNQKKKREKKKKFVQYGGPSRTVAAGVPENVPSIVNIRLAVIISWRNSSQHCSGFILMDSDKITV